MDRLAAMQELASARCTRIEIGRAMDNYDGHHQPYYPINLFYNTKRRASLLDFLHHKSVHDGIFECLYMTLGPSPGA